MSNEVVYRLLVEKRTIGGWKKLEEDHPDEMKECKAFLKSHPTNIRVMKGKTKKLKGKLQDYYQYDVTYNDRVIYQVNKKSKEVKIAYAGGHP